MTIRPEHGSGLGFKKPGNLVRCEEKLPTTVRDVGGEAALISVHFDF